MSSPIVQKVNARRVHRKKIRIRVGDFKLAEVEKKALKDVIDSGRLSEGPRVSRFEKSWAKFVGTQYCVATSSGAGALISGLTALKYFRGFKNGTKVITSPLTYIATSSSISNVSFEPVYVDVDLETFNITPENIIKHLEQTRNRGKYGIILPVDLMGYPLRIDEINEIAKQYNLVTFEDAAQAHGTIYKNMRAGSTALLSAFSFYIAHNIQAGEMGAITTNNLEIAKLIRKIKAQGRVCDCLVCTRSNGSCPRLARYRGKDDFDPRFCHDLIGYNFKTMEFQAALALTQIEKVEWIISKRQENVKYLNIALEKYSDVLRLPLYSDNISYLAYPIVIKRPDLLSRRKLRMRLEEEGIETRPLFGCIPTQQPAYSYLKEKYERKLPNADYLGKNAFYLGCHQYLDECDLEYIVETFNKIFSTNHLVKRSLL